LVSFPLRCLVEFINLGLVFYFVDSI
jgi:hypothetical protein